MHKGFLATGIALGGIAVILGAFAAHKLKQTLSADAMNIFETGVRYQFYHAFALIITGMLFDRFGGQAMQIAGWSFVAGILLFSGSLYALSFFRTPKIGIITPFGGLAFIAGWLFLLLAVLRAPQR